LIDSFKYFFSGILFVSLGHSHLKLVQVAGVSSACCFCSGKHWGLGKSLKLPPREADWQKTEAAEPHNREAHAAFVALSWPYTSACFQSFAVTFGTATSSSKDVGLIDRDSKISRFWFFLVNLLPPQTQTIHYLMVALNIRTLQVVEQTPSLRDHFQQAAPRVIILLVSLEMLGQVGNSLAQKRYLYLGRTRVGLMGTEV
jgi:hypothetical protein